MIAMNDQFKRGLYITLGVLVAIMLVGFISKQLH